MNTQESDKKSQALLKFALSNHNTKRYNEAAGFYEVILKRYPKTEAAQYAKTNLGSLINKVNELEPIQPDEPLIAHIEQSIDLELVPNQAAKISKLKPKRKDGETKNYIVSPIMMYIAICCVAAAIIIGGGGLYYKRLSNISEAKKSLIDVLKNPDTVKFRNEVFFKTPGVICGEFNAQNSMGGYVGFKKYIAKSKFFLIEDEDVLSWDPIEIENILGISVSAVQSIQSTLGKEYVNRDLLGILWKINCEK